MPVSQRQRILFLFLTTCLLVVVAAKFIFPKILLAATPPAATNTPSSVQPSGVIDDNIGPELAEFDYGAETNVYNNVVAGKFSGTVQAINNVTNPNPKNPAKGYVLQKGRFVLRLTGITAQTTVAQMQTYAQNLKTSSEFPDGTLVVVGNELNNLDLEWKDPTGGLSGAVAKTGSNLTSAAEKYATLYNAFASILHGSPKYQIAPAPPDTYNAVYDPKPWIASFASHVNCGLIDTLVANVFDAPSQVGGSSLDTYKYLEQHICGKTVTHFGGYGANPDTSTIRQQIDFYKTHPLTGNVKSAATLIVDSCLKSNATKSNWLFMIRGRVFRENGSEITNFDTCSGDQKKDIYYEYNLHRDQDGAILNHLYDEYSVSCLPKKDYQFVINHADQCLQVDKKCDGWNASGQFHLDASGKLFSLFRDEQQANTRSEAAATSANITAPTPNRFESMEQYFSTRFTNDALQATAQQTTNGPTGSTSNANVNADTLKSNDPLTYQSPLYKLTTLAQQCQFGLDKLKAVKALCDDRIPNNPNPSPSSSPTPPPSTGCALDLKIPGTDFTNLGLLSAFGSTSCDTLMAQDRGSMPVDQQKLADAILAVNPIMENAYRPAFIVAVTKFDNTTDQNNPWFRAQGVDRKDGYTTVSYFEIKEPVFGSDLIKPDSPKSVSDPSVTNRYYPDALQLTGDALTTTQAQQDWQKKEDADRNAVRTSGATYTSGPAAGGAVLCQDSTGKYQECTKSTDPVAHDLVTFMNAQKALGPDSAVPCEGTEPDLYPDKKNPTAEQSDSIGSTFDSQDIGTLVKKKALDVKISAHADQINGKLQGNAPHTDLYLVGTHKYALAFAAQALNSRLSLDAQQQLAKSGDFSTLTKTNITPSFTGAGDQSNNQRTITVPTDANGTTDTTGTTGTAANTSQLPAATIQPATITVSASFDEAKKDAPMPILEKMAGTVANFPTRVFALATSSLNDALSTYTQGCSSDPEHATQNWLLGQCNAPTKPNAAPVPPAGACNPGSTIYTRDHNGIYPATISEGAIALALQVSKYTCTPPELLIGVLAQETQGVTYIDQENFNSSDKTSITGDPNQLVKHAFWCRDSYLPNHAKVGIIIPLGLDHGGLASYGLACGAYSWSEFDFKGAANDEIIKGQVGNYLAQARDCLDKIQVGGTSLNSPAHPSSKDDFDSRVIGQAMCITSAKFWESIQDNRQSVGLPRINCADNRHSYTLAEVDPAGVQEALLHFYAGTTQYGGFTNVAQKYNDFIQKYTPIINPLRTGSLAACVK